MLGRSATFIVMAAMALSIGCTQQNSAQSGPATGVAAGAAVAAKTGQNPPAPPAVVNLIFFDSSSFDDDMSHALKTHAKVTVAVPAPFTLNQIPPRLEKWLKTVKGSGGQLALNQTHSDTQVASRGLLGIAFDLVGAVYDSVSDAITYGPAKSYDARINYKDNGVVEEVDFTPRQPLG